MVVTSVEGPPPWFTIFNKNPWTAYCFNSSLRQAVEGLPLGTKPAFCLAIGLCEDLVANRVSASRVAIGREPLWFWLVWGWKLRGVKPWQL